MLSDSLYESLQTESSHTEYSSSTDHSRTDSSTECNHSHGEQTSDSSYHEPELQGGDITQSVYSAVFEEQAASSSEPSRPQTAEDLHKTHEIEEALRDVVDPELGINVVDLGLVYSLWIGDNNTVQVNMTLTSPACPLTDMIAAQAQDAVVGGGYADELIINWVWMPPWGPQMITDDGREQLRALGFSV